MEVFLIEPVEVIAIFVKNKNPKAKSNFKTYCPGIVKPVKFKYKELGITIDSIERIYEENFEGEKILGYRCYNKKRGYYYHLLFYTQQLKWYIKFENN